MAAVNGRGDSGGGRRGGESAQRRRDIERSRLADEGHGAGSKAGGSNKYHRCVGKREIIVKLDIDDKKRRDARCREIV